MIWVCAKKPRGFAVVSFLVSPRLVIDFGAQLMNNESPMMVTADCARANNGHSRSAILSQLGRFAPLAITALLTWFAMQILIDAEYIGQNFSLRGLKVFR